MYFPSTGPNFEIFNFALGCELVNTSAAVLTNGGPA